MTEDQIERKVERMMDSLDRDFLRGDLTQAEYDAEVKNIDRWSKEAYRAQ